MEKSYRIHTNISQDTLLNVNMKQSFDFLEVLSLKLRQKDAYRLHSSNYGVIIGRVLANDAFGIPNAKISVFIERDENDSVEIENIYPYSEVTSQDSDGRRYNLLPDYSDDDCYRVVGTFPNKRYLLDDDNQVEVYDRYWRYTTVSNNAGDYMIFGVPAGSQQVHVDIDLSDIGILSQKPRDFIYRGYDISEFDSPSQFKESTNFDSLRQIFTQDKSVYVYPFWGDDDNGVAAITRCDIQITYNFEPTCVFMGSIISDNGNNSIGHKCAANINNGMNDQLIGGNGTIEMIRKTPDGLVEEYPIQGNALIDNDGVWCYQIPMNLDYVGTDEYGNIVPTDSPTRGIPTRTQVRFRVSKNETGDEGFSRHTAKYLVPMNPIFSEDEVVPTIDISGQEVERMYNFGSSTPDSCFRDLYWNNVYSVKNYVPKAQVAHRPFSKNYTALKGSNLAEDVNPIPFNKFRVDVPFNYSIVCILFMLVTGIVALINASVLCPLYEIVNTINKVLKVIRKVASWTNPFGGGKAIPTLDKLLKYLRCMSLSAGLEEGNDAFYPGCWCKKYGDCPSEMEGDCNKRESAPELIDRVQRNLAREYKIIKLDFYQDWINGCLYMPLWYWRKTKKRTFLFGLIKKKAKSDFCSCENSGYSRLKAYTTCELPYENNSLKLRNITRNGKNIFKENKWHKNRAEWVRYRRGLIRPFINKDDLTVYYYAALQATSDNNNPKQALSDRPADFHAVRLYATDIILLGNLNENNLYGIPQFFTCLPPTTANIPPIATVEEENTNDEEKENYTYEASAGNDEDGNGTTVITGMDWKRDDISEHDTPNYRQGLFMDLGCTFADTLAKSCINVERLSELGVMLDSTYTMRYSNSSESEIQSGDINTDGFITKLELDDMENRAMFATMNHIGFIPQEYQDYIDSYDTQVMDENTGYLVPKMKYIYSVDFDGRQQEFMTRYRNGFAQPMYDERDEAYLTFRLGAERNGEYGRIRHFYHTPTDNDAYYMPLYNNSFYFYFGIRNGSTAIDKFNKMFYAPCFQNDKKPFTMIIETTSRSYCPEAYENPQDGMGSITVTLDDIRLPYSYLLRDSFGEEVISGENISDRVLVIRDGFQRNPYRTSGLTNQTYHLEIMDADGRRLTERVILDMPKITMDYNVTHLSSKFYTSASTRMDYICNDDNHFYGIIDISGLTVDGYDCTITAAELVGYSVETGYQVRITGTSDVSNNIVAVISLKSMDFDDKHLEKETRNCLCDSSSNIAYVQRANMNIEDANIGDEYLGFNDGVVSFFVYQPASFVGTIIQMCNGAFVVDNSTSSIITVNNATNFNTYLNDMPTNFIIGSVNDNVGARVGNTSHFYNTVAQTSPTSPRINGWLGVHQEDSYQFSLSGNTACDANRLLWEDYVLLSDAVHTSAMKRRILQFKFESMFSLSNAIYVSDEYENELLFTSRGGRQPVLIRSIAPHYDNDVNLLAGKYLFKDSSMVDYLTNYPNVVGSNASGHSGSGGASFNENFKESVNLQGNYFAGFTDNGGYTSSNKIDGSIDIMRQPNFASISPYNGNRLKLLGKDEIINKISDANLVHTTGTQRLPGDKSRTVNPWLRVLTVDRRYDYDFTIIGPVMGDTFKLHNEDEKERPWKGLRISGFTYNGIEMSYDEEHNIISATTTLETDDGEVTTQTANKRLEYSYNYSSGDTEAYVDRYDESVDRGIYVGENYAEAVTIYNHEANTVWAPFHVIKYNNQEFGYQPNIDTNDKQLIKESYINDFAGFDLRNFYWSRFNRERLYKYTTIGHLGDNKQQDQNYGVNAFENLINPFYVFYYPYGNPSLYNGDFNREDASNGSYPTRRFIDIANFEPSTYYHFENESCTYGITVEDEADGFVRAHTDSKEALSFDLEFNTPINFTSPNDANEEFGNVVYVKGGTSGGYAVFNATTVHLHFNYNLIDNEEFNIYTSTPRLIKVLPYTNETDGITYIKSVNPGGEGLYGDGKTLDGAISDLTICEFKTSSHNIFEQALYGADITTPQGVDESRGFFKKGGELLPSNDNDFTNIIFAKYEIDLQGATVFAIQFERQYKHLEENGLTKHIRTIEFGDLYDARYLLLKDDSANSYVEYKKIDTVTPVDEPIGGSVDTGTGEVTIDTETVPKEGEGKLYTQTLSFKMRFDMEADPEDIQNCAFADFRMMGYIFEFVDSNEAKHFIRCSDVESERMGGTLELTFHVKWTQNMGILSQAPWNGSANVSVYAKAPSGFTYKLGNNYFSIVLNGGQELPTKEGYNNRKLTNFSIA